MTITVHFLRHLPPAPEMKKVFYGLEEIPLEIDRFDVQQQLDLLADIFPSDAYWISSPSHRCLKTAELLRSRKAFQRDIVINDGFKEQNFGVWVNRPKSEIIGIDPDYEVWKSDVVNNRNPKGESFRDCHDRVVSTTSKIFNEIPDGSSIVISSHGGPWRAIYAYATGIDLMLALKLDIVQPLVCMTLTLEMYQSTLKAHLKTIRAGVAGITNH